MVTLKYKCKYSSLKQLTHLIWKVSCIPPFSLWICCCSLKKSLSSIRNRFCYKKRERDLNSYVVSNVVELVSRKSSYFLIVWGPWIPVSLCRFSKKMIFFTISYNSWRSKCKEKGMMKFNHPYITRQLFKVFFFCQLQLCCLQSRLINCKMVTEANPKWIKKWFYNAWELQITWIKINVKYHSYSAEHQ